MEINRSKVSRAVKRYKAERDVGSRLTCQLRMPQTVWPNHRNLLPHKSGDCKSKKEVSGLVKVWGLRPPHKNDEGHSSAYNGGQRIS